VVLYSQSVDRPPRTAAPARDLAAAVAPYVLGEELSAADIQLSFIAELAAARFGRQGRP
jgi:hypothetical protein